MSDFKACFESVNFFLTLGMIPFTISKRTVAANTIKPMKASPVLMSYEDRVVRVGSSIDI